MDNNNKIMEVIVPFSGFYHSVHNDYFDNTLEYCFNDDSGSPIDYDDHDSLASKASDCINWRETWVCYADAYTDMIKSDFNLDSLKFKDLISPKYYNYETDRILAEISFSDVMAMYEAIDIEDLKTKVKELFTSCSGYISHYPSNLDDWDSDLANWDHNQVMTLMEVYLKKIDKEEYLGYKLMDCWDSYYEVCMNCIVVMPEYRDEWSNLHNLRDQSMEASNE